MLQMRVPREQDLLSVNIRKRRGWNGGFIHIVTHSGILF
jgi:hypothetical protein